MSPATTFRGADGGFQCEVLVIGSGFGGSVAALRLSEKGYRVTVVEAGRRFTPATLPRTSWQLRRFLWAPALGCRGIQRIVWLKDVVALCGAGVGGGSLVYANVLFEPPDQFYRDPQWAHITDWRAELAPHFAQASRMLGVVQNPTITPADELIRGVARELGVAGTFRLTPVGVHFGVPGRTVPDPYFGGQGPDRTGCLQCGACMTGCRHGAKNSLDVNYLHLAERSGAVILADTTAVGVVPDPAGAGYRVRLRPTGPVGRLPGQDRTIITEQVVFAAGTIGTQRLLHAMRDTGRLPRLSPRLGELTRTNSEALVGAVADAGGRTDFSTGVAITSSFWPDVRTHVEPVRYGPGSNLMGLLGTLLTAGESRRERIGSFLRAAIGDPRDFARSLAVRRWSQRAVIALTMQTLDNSLTLYRRRRGPVGYLTSRAGHGTPTPSWIPAANDVARRVARRMPGQARGGWPQVFGVPLTAHVIGGCPIGADATHGVVDPYQRLFGHAGLHVADGSVLSANPGVNPSLTITAQAERAFALWPNRGDPDPRPELGSPYERIDPVPPRRPAVPAGAPAALPPGPA